MYRTLQGKIFYKSNISLQFFQERVSWFKAKRKCISKGENLLEIHSEDENRYIHKLFPKHGSTEDPKAWIGGENHADQVNFI